MEKFSRQIWRQIPFFHFIYFILKMSSIRFSIVVAMNKLRGIGKEGGLPWRLKEDMKMFKNLTTNTKVIEIYND